MENSLTRAGDSENPIALWVSALGPEAGYGKSADARLGCKPLHEVLFMPAPSEYALNWLEQSKSPSLGDDPFMRFMNAWIGFNAIYADKFESIDGDRNQVRSFAKDDHLVSIHKMLLNEVPDYVAAIDVFAEHGVLSLRKGVRYNITKERKLIDVLECVYQARCNCVHGGKHHENKRDRGLVRAGFVIVVNLLSMYFQVRASRWLG